MPVRARRARNGCALIGRASMESHL